MSEGPLGSAKVVQRFDDLIRSGRVGEVARELAKINCARVPRKSRLPLANLCRRVGLNTVGLRLLAPVVRPLGRKASPVDASEAECAEYAVLLLRRGIIREASEILNGIKSDAAPEAHLYRAFCEFRQWNYAGGISHLQTYLACDVDNYSRLVGSVNLAAAYIGSGQYQPGLCEIEKVRGLIQQENHGRLLGNCMELEAQIAVNQGEYDLALRHLDAAESILADMPTLDHFFVTKWRAITHSLRDGHSGPIEELRKTATVRGHWDTAREADRFLLKLMPSTQRLEHLIFGTPHSAYRQRVYHEMNLINFAQTYFWGTQGGQVIDLTGVSRSCFEEFAEWGKCGELIEILTRDFYAPMPLGMVFAELWPGDYFDIFSSPTRLHQITYRTRQLLHEYQLPFTIEEREGAYRILFNGPGGFLVPLDRRSLGGYRMEFERLCRLLPGNQPFTARQARQALNMPRVTFQRFTHWALAQNLFQRLGQGPTTSYKISA